MSTRQHTHDALGAAFDVSVAVGMLIGSVTSRTPALGLLGAAWLLLAARHIGLFIRSAHR